MPESRVLQLRRMSRATRESKVFAIGEAIYDKTLKALAMGDGALFGGTLLKRWGKSYTVTPAAIAADQNDYNPPDLAIAETLVLTSDAMRKITGIVAGGSDRRLTLINVGAFNIYLVDASGASVAANRFAFGDDVVLLPGGAIDLHYSAGDNRWHRGNGGVKLSSIPEDLRLPGAISPAQIVADQNDYAPAGLALATVLRLSADAARSITGLVDARDGAIKTIVNVGVNTITLKNADAGSAAANRFDFGVDVALGAKQACVLRYDAAEARWKLLATTAGTAVADAAVSASKLGTSAFGLRTGMINGKIVEAHAAAAATFSIKTLTGNDPSAVDPVRVVFHDGAGGYVVRDITAALSLTLSAGSTLGFVNGEASRLWLVLIDTGAGVVLGAINCRRGTSVMGLLDSVAYTTTAEGGAGGADSAQVIYSAVSQASKFLCIAGYVDYDGGLAEAGAWSASPSRISLFGPGTPRPGVVVQRAANISTALNSGNSTIPLDNTVPQATEGDQFFTLSVTPFAAANLLEVSGSLCVSFGADARVTATLFRDAGADAIASDITVTNGSVSIRRLLPRVTVIAGAAAATTFKMRGGANGAGAFYVNSSVGNALYGGTLPSGLEVKEIMG